MDVPHIKHLSALASCIPLVAIACSSEIGVPGAAFDDGASNADGDGTTVIGEDGSQMTVGEDGTITTVNTDGSTTIRMPDGTVTTTSPDGMTTTTDDGAGLGGGTATGGDTTDSVANPSALPMQLDGEPIFARTVRLTHSQWERSVQYLLQLDGPTGHLSSLAEDAAAVHDFTNNEELMYVSGPLWTDYSNAATDLATAVANDAARLGAIYSGNDATGFIETFGRRAFRRPLLPDEVGLYQELFDVGAGLSDNGATEFARGAGLVIEAMLQSPHFLYRVVLSEPGARLNGYEVAAKLSLLLRGTTPDDALLDLAANGGLDSDAGINAEAAKMVEEANIVEVMREYHGEMLRFNRFLQIEKDRSTVPEYTSELNAELEEASYRFFDHVYENDLGVRGILLSDVAYAGPAMAQLYGMQGGGGLGGGGLGGPGGGGLGGGGITEVPLGDERAGYFTQLPFLILNSVNEHPDSIHRGVAINSEVLCAEVPPPPDADNIALVAAEPGWSNRQRVEATTGPGTCGSSCHGLFINPLGYAFENFDGLGRTRDMDNGNPVDTKGSYPFSEGDFEFDGAASLMEIIAEGEQAHSCYAKHLTGYALQRDLTEADRPLIDAVAAESRANDASIKQLLLALVSDPAFVTQPAGGAQ